MTHHHHLDDGYDTVVYHTHGDYSHDLFVSHLADDGTLAEPTQTEAYVAECRERCPLRRHDDS